MLEASLGWEALIPEGRKLGRRVESGAMSEERGQSHCAIQWVAWGHQSAVNAEFRGRTGYISPRSAGDVWMEPRGCRLPSPTCELSLSFSVSPGGVVVLIFLKSEEGAQGNFLRECRCFIIDRGHVYETAHNYQNSINCILKMDEKNHIRGRGK